MLTKSKIQEALFDNLFQPTTPTAANKIAADLGLPPGSVVLGKKAIEITESGQTRYVQLTPDGKGIVFVDPSIL